MMPRSPRVLHTKGYSRRVWVLIVLTALSGTVLAGTAPSHLPIVAAMDEPTPWSVTLHISEPNGTGNTVVFGVEPNASDGQDLYDMPSPPAPPQYPFILAWFATTFPAPFERLLQEYKPSSSARCVWNLSVLWAAQPGNTSLTTLKMTWEPPNAASGLLSLYLYENTSIVANMLINRSYSYPANSSLHRFQIISQSTTTDGSPTPTGDDLPLVPLLVSIVLILVLLLVVGVRYRKKKT